MEAGALIANRFRLVRLVGAGGMGEVWEATHEVTSKRVAIKVLNATYARQASVRARFLREARAACRVRHPNVVQVHDVFELPDGSPAMVMDLLNGESLASKLEREGSIPMGELATILAPVAHAIAAAHALGIVHRDLKPDNLFLERTSDGKTTVKVLDFGIAKVSGDERKDAALTSTGAVLGTPFYMSPEQAFGEKDVDSRSDVWSFGIILWECIVGRRPTEADNFGQILKTITTDRIPALASMASGVPDEISALTTRMLSRDRFVRPALHEVAAVLERYVKDTSTIVISTSDRPRPDAETAFALTDTDAPLSISAVAGLPKPRSRSRIAAVALACAVVLGGAGALKARLGASAQGPTSAAATPVAASAPAAAVEIPAPAIEPAPPIVAELDPGAAPKAALVKRAAEAVLSPPSAPAPQAPASPAPSSSTVAKLHQEQPF